MTADNRRRQGPLWAIVIAAAVLAACGGGDSPTRTPVPTWTPTPAGGEPVVVQQAPPPTVPQ